jgi:hypothetical protein
MSWKHQSAFQVNTNTTTTPKIKVGRPYVEDKEKSFYKVETEILKADMIESSLLMMNNKNMMITSDRVNIHTNSNSLIIPSTAPISVNENLVIDKEAVHIRGNLNVDKKLKSAMNMYLVHRLLLNRRIEMDVKYYNQCNHYMIDCPTVNAKGEILMKQFHSYTADWSPTEYEHLYIIHFSINAHKDSLVDIDVILDGQELRVKLQSRYSSLSLLWVPEGKWLVHALGYKSIILDM